VLTIGRGSLADPLVPIRLQQDLQHVFKRRPDDPLDIEGFVGFMPKRTECCEAAR
jgi:hypothetical protein